MRVPPKMHTHIYHARYVLDYVPSVAPTYRVYTYLYNDDCFIPHIIIMDIDTV